MLDVTFFRDFKEDRRISMELYADKLSSSLISMFPDELAIKGYTPEIPHWCKLPLINKQEMRIARFVSYPMQALFAKATISHIVDHGYAHLLMALNAGKSVVTVHDLIPLLGYNKRIQGLTITKRPVLLEFSLGFLKKAGHVIADSHNTKRDLLEFGFCDEEKISVVYPGINRTFERFSEASKMALRKSFGFSPDEKIILISGPAGTYKNHETSLKILIELKKHYNGKVRLIRFGRFAMNGGVEIFSKMVADLGLDDCVISTGSIEQKRLVELVNSVDCLLFPSWYEGYGWPPLEAMACGLPVVASNVASLPEIVGDAGIMADPWDVESLTKAVIDVFSKQTLRETLIDRGLQRCELFSWELAAKKIYSIYQMLSEKEV